MEPRINYPKVVPGALEAMLGFRATFESAVSRILLLIWFSCEPHR